MIKEKYKVSVVIPAKNRIPFLKEALRSVYKQSANVNMEVIVVDDLSDISIERNLKKLFPKVKFLLNNKKIHGPGAARNIGLNNSTGDYVAFLDSDDVWDKDFLAESLKILIKKKCVATVCMTDPFFYGSFSLFRRYKLLFLNFIRLMSLKISFFLNNGYLPRSAFYLCQLSHMLFSKTSLRGVRFNEESIAAEDWEFNLKVGLKGKTFIVNKKLVKFRYTMTSTTLDRKLIAKKRNTYIALTRKIPLIYRHDIFYYLFLSYIHLFLVK